MTQDEIIELARRAGFGDGIVEFIGVKTFQAFSKLVAEKEREACAKLCEEQMQGKSIWIEGAKACSLVIRARGQA
jgi:hypothetical protein